MTQRERQGWLIVASLWITLFLVFGGSVSTGAVFFTPLLKQFHWSRAQLSSLQSLLALMMGLSGPLVGWLLDRIEARIIMAVGAALAAIAFLFASRLHSYGPMLAAYLMVGLGVCATTMVPCALVVANWFDANRGTAMGFMFTGQSLGGSVMAMVVSYAILRGGWRAGYIAIALPILVIVVPAVLLIVRSRPPEAQQATIRELGSGLPGFELRAAIRTRSFCMIMTAQFFFGFVVVGLSLHLVSYLIGLGYSSVRAAGILSLTLLCSAAGKFLWGIFADRVTARVALCVNFTTSAIGLLLIHGAANSLFLFAFVFVYGLGQGSPVALLPLVTADSLGLKRYGSITGITNAFSTIGAAFGPVIIGRIFDVTGSYSLAFDIAAAMYFVSVVAIFACRPLEAEQSHRAAVEAAA